MPPATVDCLGQLRQCDAEVEKLTHVYAGLHTALDAGALECRAEELLRFDTTHLAQCGAEERSIFLCDGHFLFHRRAALQWQDNAVLRETILLCELDARG